MLVCQDSFRCRSGRFAEERFA